ncbi:MAG: CoA-binding protein [Bacteroidetes bacterium]|nr:MAG: CoA-binding protein [Bacteroidota bacterium]
MIVNEIINPKSIAVIGGSRNTSKPGGKILKNLIEGSYSGELYVVNNNDTDVQGLPTFPVINELPEVEMAIIAIGATHALAVVEELAKTKNTKAFIIISAGFGELGENGKKIEKQLAEVVNAVKGTLIGPNCIGLINKNYQGVFTSPIPKLSSNGCDFVSSSGAMAVFFLEVADPVGLQFNSIYSIGNAAQTTVEDVLEYWDDNYDPETSSRTKLIYIENISDPARFLKYSRSLIMKGCKIAAIKGGDSEAGNRAAASHTGAMANSSLATRALLNKAGIVHCSSREEMVSVASVFNYTKIKGKNIAIVTHAGGSAVLLTDALTKGGLSVPKIEGPDADSLLTYLNPGSSVSNPIDFLATGTAEQLGIIIDYCNFKLKNIDAIIVVFGSPGLFDVENVYKVLGVKLEISQTPIFPVLPSIVNAQKEIKYFLSKGHVNFPDEVILAKALTAVHNTRLPAEPEALPKVDSKKINAIINNSKPGLLPQDAVLELLDAASIPRTRQFSVHSEEEAIEKVGLMEYPVALKVEGIAHKTEVHGVILNIHTEESLIKHYRQLMEIDGATGVLMQDMVRGNELFIGAKYEEKFGHLVLVGIGGIFLELIKDVNVGLSPLNRKEVQNMIRGLKGYKIIEGYRGKPGSDEDTLVNIVLQVCALLEAAPQIKEMDINPIIGYGDDLKATDVRIEI